MMIIMIVMMIIGPIKGGPPVHKQAYQSLETHVFKETQVKPILVFTKKCLKSSTIKQNLPPGSLEPGLCPADRPPPR